MQVAELQVEALIVQLLMERKRKSSNTQNLIVRRTKL